MIWESRYLNKISLESGSTMQLCECDASFGATWGADGTIVFAGDCSGLCFKFLRPEANHSPSPPWITGG